MITLNGVSESTLVIKKSKFLGLACRAESEKQVQSMLDQRKKQHYDAKHNCWAYMLADGSSRYSDDGEPQGTAGLPILKVIESSGVSDVLVICTRYFGGILLGAGGLARAYTKSAADTLEAAEKVEIAQCEIYRCNFSYSEWAKAEKAFVDAGFSVDDIVYSSDVDAVICVPPGCTDRFSELIKNLTLGKCEPALLGERMVEIISK